MERNLITVLLALILSNQTGAQTTRPVTTQEIKSIVHKIADSLEFYYVNFEQGKLIGSHIKHSEKTGKFLTKSPDTLAKKLTEDLRSVNGDLHLSVVHRPHDVPIETYESKIKRKQQAHKTNFGIPELKILDGNIGYMKISSFSNWDYFEETKQVVSASMKYLENSNALIFDIRNNKGGIPNLVAFLCSYLFEEKPIHLAQYYHRYRKNGYGLYTENNIPGKRLPDIPVFIIVNKKTASAAEEFAFFLKHLKRATIVGKTTAGAGYGAMYHRLNDRFFVSISSEEDISPLTKSSIQKTGVIPTLFTEDKEALTVTRKLAENAAENYELKKLKKQKNLLNAFNSISSETELTEIIDLIKICHKEELINFNDINSLGYTYLDSAPAFSEAIFKTNIELYPDISNVYDSYADALLENQKLEEAMENYSKAIEIGIKENSKNISTYKNNLAKVKSQLPNYHSEIEVITKTLNDYIEGTANGDSKRIEKAFHKNLNLYSVVNDTLNITPGKTYISYFENGKKRNRIGKIISIDYENNAAIAKIDIFMADREISYTDYFLLLKINNSWKIIHKSYTRKTE